MSSLSQFYITLFLVVTSVSDAFVANPLRISQFSRGHKTWSTSGAEDLVQRLVDMVEPLDRGFKCTKSERGRVEKLLDELSKVNPTEEPGAAFYEEGQSGGDDPDQIGAKPSIAGRWRLIYTDAPDIIALGDNQLAELGRIGQECDAVAKTISNVIEWSPPSWLKSGVVANSFPFTDDQVEQRIVLRASSDKGSPFRVQLFVEGFDLVPQKFLGSSTPPNALRLRGPLSGKIPFGAFDVLYLDDTLRAVRTSQGFYAVNIRETR